MRRIALFPIILFCSAGLSSDVQLDYAPSPPDNPLMGLVPYLESNPGDRFPHSMQFTYLALSDLLVGANQFDWSGMEEALETTSSRGCQLVVRVYLEYPSKKMKSGIPKFLIDDGLKVTRWKNNSLVNLTPDYDDPKLAGALVEFITAFGTRYDNDSRLGFVTAGLLGSWGEWHTFPRTDLFASKAVQKEVMGAFSSSFKKTPVLLRYPANGKQPDKAKNSHLNFGYHDDSFGWSTLDTGKKEDSWFFLPQMREAGTLHRWKTRPIGGEIRPELWEDSFSAEPHPKSQNFASCVEQTHVTWLLDSGLFEKRYPLPPDRKKRAIEEVRKMGYSLHVSGWSKIAEGIEIVIENRGVAPFYRDWPLVFSLWKQERQIWKKSSSISVHGILPGTAKKVKIRIPDSIDEAEVKVAIPNPMKGGRPIKFANKTQGDLWLTLGKYRRQPLASDK